MKLYHVTKKENAPSILRYGINPRRKKVYLATDTKAVMAGIWGARDEKSQKMFAVFGVDSKSLKGVKKERTCGMCNIHFTEYSVGHRIKPSDLSLIESQDGKKKHPEKRVFSIGPKGGRYYMTAEGNKVYV
jgi:hypothetical protein